MADTVVEPLTAAKIYGFATSLLLERLDSPQPTPDFHIELWELCCSIEKWVAIAAPRGHAKSTAITFIYVLAMVLFKQRDFVLIVSDTESQAIAFLGDIKRALTENDALIRTFNIRKLVKDTETDVIVEFTDGEQFRILAKGSEQKVRGLIWRNKRPNLIIGDDLENDEIVMNDDRRKKFRSWLFKALIPAGSDDCIVRLVGTILHMDAALERLMPKWNDPDTKTDGLKFWSEKKGLSWKSFRYQAHNKDFSQILWKEKFPKERLEAIRQLYIEQGEPEGYSQEYLNYPIDEEHAYFRKSDFPHLDDESPSDVYEYYVGGDLAISERDATAYTVFVVAALDQKGILSIVNIIRFRGDSLEIIDTIFRLHATYKPRAFFLEKENIMRSIWPMLVREMNVRQQYPAVDESTLIIPTQDKVKRAQAIRARARAGGVRVDHTATWYHDFITELIQFPRGAYKDQVDGLAMIGLGLDKMNDVPSRREIIDEELDNEYYNALETGTFSSRNWITGY